MLFLQAASARLSNNFWSFPDRLCRKRRHKKLKAALPPRNFLQRASSGFSRGGCKNCHLDFRCVRAYRKRERNSGRASVSASCSPGAFSWPRDLQLNRVTITFIAQRFPRGENAVSRVQPRFARKTQLIRNVHDQLHILHWLRVFMLTLISHNFVIQFIIVRQIRIAIIIILDNNEHKWNCRRLNSNWK